MQKPEHPRKGGLTVLQRYGPEHMREIGRRGGLATVQRYGREYMREIGRRGAAVTWQRYDLQPVGVSGWAMVERESGKVVAVW